MSNSTLFLHYGPGGSSDVEAGLLAADLPEVLFWNQSKVKDQAKPYQKLVKDCLDQTTRMKATRIIGHSFGCDLLASILKMIDAQMPHSKIENSILISPLQNIPQAMLSLGRVLNQRENGPALTKALQLATPYSGSPPPEIFWNLIMQIGTHPLYLSAFWVDQTAKQRSDQLAAVGPAFDPGEFQTVMQDYLFEKEENDNQAFKNKKIKAIFGDSDPYFTTDDISYWRTLLGSEQVFVIKNCGHFPHLEKQDEFLKIVRL